jgi:hypothetical protein
MWNAYAVEQEVRLRLADDLRRAARARLLREAAAGSTRRRPAPHRRLLYWFGGRLVSWGSRLQARVERPELERTLATTG